MKHGKQKLWQAASCVLCAAVTWRIPAALAGSEFSGGLLTGSLLTLYESGTYLFLLALLMTFVYERIAAGIALTASLLCVPLYLYFEVPGLFRRVANGEYSIPLQANFVWDKWAIIGMLALAVAVYVCLRGLVVTRTKLQATG
jgi:hypothetical protein